MLYTLLVVSKTGVLDMTQEEKDSRLHTVSVAFMWFALGLLVGTVL